MVSAIVTAIADALTSFVPTVGKALVDGFTALFWVAPVGEGTGSLTTLAQGLLALAGIGLTIGAVIKVYHIFSGRVRRSM